MIFFPGRAASDAIATACEEHLRVGETVAEIGKVCNVARALGLVWSGKSAGAEGLASSWRCYAVVGRCGE